MLPNAAGLDLPSEAPLRILQIITRLNVGGPARHVLGFEHALRARGHTMLLVHGSLDPSEGSLEDLVAAGQVPAPRMPALRRPPAPWHDLCALWQLTRLLFVVRPDVVHTHTAKAGTLGRMAAAAYNIVRPRADRCLVVHTFHGHVFEGYFGAIGSRMVQLVERGLACLTDRIITVSEGQKREISDRYRIAAGAKIDAIEIGTDLDSLLTLETQTRLRADLGFSPDDVVFGFVGRFVAIKDLATLVQAFARVLAAVPHARLMLVGDGELRGGIESLAGEMGLVDSVRFTGWRRDMKEVYGAIDVQVLASLNEGTPLALVEAMAAAKPVIATAVGGVSDLVTAGRTGYLVPPRDPARLAAAMIRLAVDPRARCELGTAARQEIATRFDIAHVAPRIFDLYRRGLVGRRGTPVLGRPALAPLQE